MVGDLVSVIIPVYNAEPFIEKCVESVVAQTYRPIEIVIVDDGSTDRSLEILKLLQLMHPDIIKIIEQKNKGVSEARNTAIFQAKGKYLSFLDSDDEFLPDYLTQAVQSIENHGSEMTIAAFNLIKDNSEKYKVNYIKEKEDSISVKTYINWMITYHDEAYWGANWNKLYISSIIKKNKISFKTGVSIGEDFYFNLQYLMFVNRISLINKAMYNYRADTTDSLSKAKRNPKEYLNQYIKILQIYEKLCNLKANEQFFNLNKFIQGIVFYTLYIAIINNGYNFSDFKDLCRYIRNSNIYQNVDKNVATNKQWYYAIYFVLKHKDYMAFILFHLIKIRRIFSRRLK